MCTIQDELTNLPLTASRKWVLRHPALKREKDKRNYNPVKTKEKNRRFKELNPTYGKAYNRYRRLKDRADILQLLGGKCANPFNIDHTGFENNNPNYMHCLQIDHVNGHGIREKKSSQNNYYVFVLAKIRAGSKDYQLLCANCNWIKRYLKKEK